ncbi:MAG: UDP-N-acetylmuramoyl-L-alanine--D-glutamate ligase [Candidatus Absconditabacterales bacterium]
MINFETFQNKKIAILGYGREGKSSLQFLLKIGIFPKNITILDEAKKIEGLGEDFGNINQEVNLIFGDKYLDTLKVFDIIIKTSGISLYNKKIYPHKQKITSQAQIFFDYYKGKIIAVSGTKGKSTTSTLIYETIKHAQKNVVLVGNIGKPVLDNLDTKNLASQKNEYAVFEVSSYMLEGLKKNNYISILLNIYSDHTDWHDGFDNYERAKLNILNNSKYNLVRDEIINKDIFDKEDLKELNIHIFGHIGDYIYKDRKFFAKKKEIFDDHGIILKGEHNMMNISAVLGVCDIMKIDYTILEETIATFKGLPHRMENIGIYGGITWIDDAISTTPESTIQAIQTYGNQIDTIFLGGTDRGYVFNDLISCIRKSSIRNIVVFPDSGERIADAIKNQNIPVGKEVVWIKIFATKSMKEAIEFAYKNTKNGKICLLSTASPSYSVRKNFEEKGDLFKKYIKELV